MASLLRNAISGKGATRAGKGKEGGVLPLLALPLMMKVLGKGVTNLDLMVFIVEITYLK